MKLLLHTCCAPCSVYCIDSLRKEGIEPVLYWYNPNIHPYMEYKARRDCLKEYAKNINVQAIFEEEYGLDEFCKNVCNDLKSRCINYCYPVRLRKTFEYAKANGYDAVSTTLLYSIYQNHEFIKSYMERLSEEFGITFLYRDFREGFWEGHEKAKSLELYMQKYCGCVFSEEDRYQKKIDKDMNISRHSIIIIQNKKNEYLQYFDKEWESYLFLNCKLPNGKDRNAIINKIENSLGIKKENIEVTYCDYRKHKKFSQSAKREKEYIHYFYKVKILEELEDNEFEINGVDYKWLSYEELLQDKRIQEVNSDIVQFVKEINC